MISQLTKMDSTNTLMYKALFIDPLFQIKFHMVFSALPLTLYNQSQN